MNIFESRKLMQLEEKPSETEDIFEAELDEENGNFEIGYISNAIKKEIDKLFKGDSDTRSTYDRMLKAAENNVTEMRRPQVGILTGKDIKDIKYFRPKDSRVFFTVIGKVVLILGGYKKSGRTIPDQVKDRIKDRKKSIES